MLRRLSSRRVAGGLYFPMCGSRYCGQSNASSSVAAEGTDQKIDCSGDGQSVVLGDAKRAVRVVRTLEILREFHATEGEGSQRVKLEQQAWYELEHLADEDVEAAEPLVSVDIIAHWGYFSRYWGKGRDGPLDPVASPILDIVALKSAGMLGRRGGKVPGQRPGDSKDTADERRARHMLRRPTNRHALHKESDNGPARHDPLSLQLEMTLDPPH